MEGKTGVSLRVSLYAEQIFEQVLHRGVEE
jgi:hypothetical protein